MMIGGRTSRLKLTQSVKSQNLHFKSKLCVSCNSSKTQAADLEFDKFYNYTKNLDSNVNILGDVYVGLYISDLSKLAPHRHLNLFRYFAKILCCQIVDAGGPRFRTLGRFSTGRSDLNRIQLSVQDSPDFEQFRDVIDKWASHGGLQVYMGSGANITKFSTHLDLKNIRIKIDARIHPLENIEIRRFEPEFYKKCVEAHKIALSNA